MIRKNAPGALNPRTASFRKSVLPAESAGCWKEIASSLSLLLKR
jgi:hypothetical protein